MKKKIKLSINLSHTWFFDLDGTILKHNGYIDDKKDTLLNGVKEFFKKIPPKDIIIITTSRDKKNSKKTINFYSWYKCPHVWAIIHCVYVHGVCNCACAHHAQVEIDRFLIHYRDSDSRFISRLSQLSTLSLSPTWHLL